MTSNFKCRALEEAIEFLSTNESKDERHYRKGNQKWSVVEGLDSKVTKHGNLVQEKSS